jgi:uncharacterized protein involved in outer membrane biogenesis
MRKTVLIVTLLLVVVASAWWVLPSLVSSRVGRMGSEAAGIPFSIGGMSVNPFAGTASLTDVEVLSAPPFLAPYVLHIDRIEARFDSGSLLSDHILVYSVRVDGARIIVEQQGRRLNLSEVGERFRSYVASSDTSQGPRVFVQELRFENASGQLLTDLGSTEFAVAPVILRDIGSESRGTPVLVLAGEVLEPVLQKTLDSAGLSTGVLGGLRGLFGR